MKTESMEEEWSNDTVLDVSFMKQFYFIKECWSMFLKECEMVLNEYGGW
jgi:hypothetical protein